MNSLERMYKLLFLAIYLLETLTIKSKQYNRKNFDDRKQILSLISDNILIIYCDRLDVLD